METATEILKHITQVCIRNKDGSLNLGTYEVELLEKALLLVEDTNNDLHYAKTMSKSIADRLAYNKV